MSKSCCDDKESELEQLRVKQASVLKVVLAINAVMFLVEFSSGLITRSSALKADSLDMLGDAIVYGFSLYVLHRSDKWRNLAAALKGVIVVAFSIFVLIDTTFKVFSDSFPAFETMGVVGLLALLANAACLLLLLRHRNDDLNMKSTYICSRNDIISNTGVILAAFLVGLTQSKWPDIIVGYIIAALFFKSAYPILTESVTALRSD